MFFTLFFNVFSRKNIRAMIANYSVDDTLLEDVLLFDELKIQNSQL